MLMITVNIFKRDYFFPIFLIIVSPLESSGFDYNFFCCFFTISSSTFSFICVFICLCCLCLFVLASFCLFLFTRLSVCFSMYSSVCLSVFPCIHLFVCICLSVCHCLCLCHTSASSVINYNALSSLPSGSLLTPCHLPHVSQVW